MPNLLYLEITQPNMHFENLKSIFAFAKNLKEFICTVEHDSESDTSTSMKDNLAFWQCFQESPKSLLSLTIKGTFAHCHLDLLHLGLGNHKFLKELNMNTLRLQESNNNLEESYYQKLVEKFKVDFQTNLSDTKIHWFASKVWVSNLDNHVKIKSTRRFAFN